MSCEPSSIPDKEGRVDTQLECSALAENMDTLSLAPYIRAMDKPRVHIGTACTESTVVTVKHTWKIENLSFQQGKRVLQSPKIDVEGYDDIQWSIFFYPNGKALKEEYNGFISLRLCLNSCDRSFIQVRGKFSLLDEEDKDITQMWSFGPRKFKEGDSCENGRMMVKNDLFEHLEDLSSDEIFVRCELKIVFETRARKC